MESPRIKVSIIASKVASDNSCEYVNIRIEYVNQELKSPTFISNQCLHKSF